MPGSELSLTKPARASDCDYVAVRYVTGQVSIRGHRLHKWEVVDSQPGIPGGGTNADWRVGSPDNASLTVSPNRNQLRSNPDVVHLFRQHRLWHCLGTSLGRLLPVCPGSRSKNLAPA